MSPHGIDIKFYHFFMRIPISWSGNCKTKSMGRPFRNHEIPMSMLTRFKELLNESGHPMWQLVVHGAAAVLQTGPWLDVLSRKVNRLPMSCWFFPGFWPELGTSHDIKKHVQRHGIWNVSIGSHHQIGQFSSMWRDSPVPKKETSPFPKSAVLRAQRKWDSGLPKRNSTCQLRW